MKRFRWLALFCVLGILAFAVFVVNSSITAYSIDYANICSNGTVVAQSSGNISSQVGKGLPPQDQAALQNAISTGAVASQVDPNFEAAIYYIENFQGGDSGGNDVVGTPVGDGQWRDPAPPYGQGPPWATSNTGAQGPFQFEPYTWPQYSQGLSSPIDLKDAAIAAGRLLASLGAKGTSNETSLKGAAYHYNGSGPMAVTYSNDVWSVYTHLSSSTTQPSSSTVFVSGGSGSSANPVPNNVSSNNTGSLAGGEDVIATDFTDSSGAYTSNLVGSWSYAELGSSNGQGSTATRLGGLAPHTKLAITYHGQTVIAEKGDFGGDLNDAKIDLDSTIASYFKFPGKDTVHVQSVPANTPLGPLNGPIPGGVNVNGSASSVGSNCTPNGGTTLPVSLNGYVNPFANPVNVSRVDQGVDYCMQPGQPIRAIGDAQVVNIIGNWYAGQPYVWYKLLSGSLAGKYVYVSEQINISVSPGQTVPAGTIIATYAPSGTCIEMGFSEADGTTTARAYGGYTEGLSTTAGVSFNKLMVSMKVPGGAIHYPLVGQGQLPAGYP